MNYCMIPTFFAYSMMTYLIASIYYLIVTQSYGTPYKSTIDDLVSKLSEEDKARLENAKKESTTKRRNAFLVGLGIGIGFVLILRPFSGCFKNKKIKFGRC